MLVREKMVAGVVRAVQCLLALLRLPTIARRRPVCAVLPLEQAAPHEETRDATPEPQDKIVWVKEVQSGGQTWRELWSDVFAWHKQHWFDRSKQWLVSNLAVITVCAVMLGMAMLFLIACVAYAGQRDEAANLRRQNNVLQRDTRALWEGLNDARSKNREADVYAPRCYRIEGVAGANTSLDQLMKQGVEVLITPDGDCYVGDQIAAHQADVAAGAEQYLKDLAAAKAELGAIIAQRGLRADDTVRSVALEFARDNLKSSVRVDAAKRLYVERGGSEADFDSMVGYTR